jgi:hypothetical protein
MSLHDALELSDDPERQLTASYCELKDAFAVLRQAGAWEYAARLRDAVEYARYEEEAPLRKKQRQEEEAKAKKAAEQEAKAKAEEEAKTKAEEEERATSGALWETRDWRQVYEILEKAAPKPTAAQAEALTYYINASHDKDKGSKIINPYLRWHLDKSAISAQDEAHIEALCDYVNKAKLPMGSWVARMLHDDFARDVRMRLKKGMIYEDKGFTSTSARSRGLYKGYSDNLHLTIELPKGAPAVLIHQFAPEGSAEYHQHEVLIADNARFFVVDKGADGFSFHLRYLMPGDPTTGEVYKRGETPEDDLDENLLRWVPTMRQWVKDHRGTKQAWEKQDEEKLDNMSDKEIVEAVKNAGVGWDNLGERGTAAWEYIHGAEDPSPFAHDADCDEADDDDRCT